MTIEELLNYGNSYLHKDQNRLLLGTILNINPLELNLYLKKTIDEKQIDTYKNAIELMKNGEPLQYVLSNSCFYGYDFYVNKNVLIPRFETEELVYETLNYLKKYFTNPKVLDLCTGSGCIGITMKLERNDLDMTLSDISNKALEVAKINNNKYNLDCKIVQGDLFENITGKFHCIISNPPYISKDEEVMDLVKNNEPHLALYAENNGLAIYERIFMEAKNYLEKKSIIALELNSNKSELIYDLAKKYFNNANIIIKKDNYNRDRMLFILNNLE